MSKSPSMDCYDIPYVTQEGRSDRNRFPCEMLLIGEIENGYRYPFDTYRKAESDARYAKKEDITDIKSAKADKTEVTELFESVAVQFNEVYEKIKAKADKTEVNALSEIVEEKADKTETEDLRRRVDKLEYKEIEIESFTASPSTMELGSSNTVTLKWSLNKVVTSQQIDGVSVTGTSKAYNNVTSDRSYTLSVTDGQTTKSKSVSVSFANQIYYGAAENLESVTDIDKVLSNTKTRTVTVDASAGQYIIYAVPARLGGVRFFVNGFEGGFAEPEIMQLRNASNFTEPYNVYKSIRANLGVTTVEVKE